MTITPIETRYAGCKFRSRLEARWAVFFDKLNIAWEYEPQGFLVNNTPYLPDFLLPALQTWIEVKGAETELDHNLMMEAPAWLPRKRSGDGAELIILGPIPEPGSWAWLSVTNDTKLVGEPYVGSSLREFSSKGGLRYVDTNGSTPVDDVNNGDEHPGTLWLTPCAGDESIHTGWLHSMSEIEQARFKLANPKLPAQWRAYESARSARFEHGQTS